MYECFFSEIIIDNFLMAHDRTPYRDIGEN